MTVRIAVTTYVLEPLIVYATFEGEIQSWSRFERSLIFSMNKKPSLWSLACYGQTISAQQNFDCLRFRYQRNPLGVMSECEQNTMPASVRWAP